MPRNKSLPAAGATLTVELLSAYLANSTVAAQDLPDLIKATRVALTAGNSTLPKREETPSFTPAVSVRKSLSSSANILSMIDGKPYRTLRRHLAAHGLTPESYRARYDLPLDYPMVAPDYAAHRRALALQTGLGSKSRSEVGQKVDAPLADARPTIVSGDAQVPSSAKAEAIDDAPASVSAPVAMKADADGSSATSPAPTTAQVADEAAAATVTSDEPDAAPVAFTPASADKAQASDPNQDSDAPEAERRENSRQTVRQRRSKLGLFSKSGGDADKDKAPQDTAPATTTSATEPRFGASKFLERTDGSSLPAQLAEAKPTLAQPERTDPVAEASSARLILMEAIARRKAVTALYNGTVIKLSPHQLFERNGDLFITAVNASKKWRDDEERRLGQFKLAGLKSVELLDEPITPLPSFDNALPRAEDSLLLSI